MERVLAVIRMVLLAALLAGCGNGSGSGQSQKIIKAAFENFRGGDDVATAGSGPAPAQLTRAAVDALGVAMVRVRSTEGGGRSSFAAQTVHQGYVSYISQFGQMVTLNGSLITASRGIGTDLLSLTPDPSDPIVRPTPLDSWPNTITRTYRHPGRGPGGRAVTVTCRFEPGQELEVEIVEVVHKGRQIEEFCTDGKGLEFANNHFADLDSGRVWRSIQWLGPDQGAVDLEVIEPYTP